MAATIKRITEPELPFDSPYDAGYDCGKNGPNLQNCHFGFFLDPAHTAAWEWGKRDADESGTAGLTVKSGANTLPAVGVVPERPSHEPQRDEHT